MKIVVGLGNYGEKYEHTYHNIGFDVVDALAEKLGISFTKNMCKGLVAEGRLGREKILLVKPQTYVNLSGYCVKELKRKFRDARFLVVVDDIDLPRGTIRYKEHGSGGTHNGLRNIVEQIGEEFERIKIGIGRDIFMNLADYVLSNIKPEDKELFEKAVIEAGELIISKITG